MSAAGLAQALDKEATAPLHGVRFSRLGDSLVGRLLTDLLAAQGAELAALETAHVDVLIDDRTGFSNAAKPVPVLNAPISLSFTDFPRQHPRGGAPILLLDSLIHAELGLNRMGGDAPNPEPLSIASAYGAIWGAIHIATALLRRAESGAPSTIELSLFAAAKTVMARYEIVPEDAALLDHVKQPFLPLAEIYRCGDERYVQIHGAFPNFAEAFCIAAGRPEWIREARAALLSLPDRAAVQMWRARIDEACRGRSALAWEEAINAVGGACTLCRSREEWLANSHAREAHIIADPPLSSRSPVVSGVRVVASAGAAPHATPHSDIPPGKGMPLVGVRVLDFCIILAGPTCGRTLSELGADVIRIEDVSRPVGPYGALDVNRGKRSIGINLKHAEGISIARQLIAQSQVVLENLRIGKMAQLGLGYEDVRCIVPNVVYASLNCFDHFGPWATRAGWEHNAQAATGMQLARAVNGVATAVPVPVNDYSTGLLGAYGVLLGLAHARRTGESVLVNGSLARSASFIQTEEYEAILDPARQRAVRPTKSLRCGDGWVRYLPDPQHAVTEQEIVRDAAAQPVELVLDRLESAGIHAVAELNIAEANATPWLAGSGMQINYQHPRWGGLRQSMSQPCVADWHLRAGCPAPDPGEDTDSILAELGYASAEIERLISAGTVSRRVPIFASVG